MSSKRGRGGTTGAKFRTTLGLPVAAVINCAGKHAEDAKGRKCGLKQKLFLCLFESALDLVTKAWKLVFLPHTFSPFRVKWRHACLQITPEPRTCTSLPWEG